MKYNNQLLAIAAVTGSLLFGTGNAFSKPNPLKAAVCEAVEMSIPQNVVVGNVRVKKVLISSANKTIKVDLNETFSYLPLTESYLTALKKDILNALGSKYRNYTVNFTVEGKAISCYNVKFSSKSGKKERFVTRLDNPVKITKGLDNDIIAVWQSHGWYFEPKLNRWEWQRARIFQTVEDLYTQSYVMPFLMPMLENAGAYVMSPRERDTNPIEIIVDNDGGYAQNGYAEINNDEEWHKGAEEGFAYLKKQYGNNENPFKEGSYTQIETTTNANKASKATWSANFPKAGEYAVYVSYKTLPNSAKDAVYTVNHEGGSSRFMINQKMGSGTWIYLGHFMFGEGKQAKPVVELSNLSKKTGAVVTADAVKIGGGFGNIARIVSAASENVKGSDSQVEINTENPTIDYKYQISNYPRFVEGARYWLQWAGVPDSIYSPSQNVNDYTDDYRCRGIWVNYLAGGSKVYPEYKGLNIPVDMAFAFHSDAGTVLGDTIIGTLGIYCTAKNADYKTGERRMISRKLTDYIQSNIVNDVRRSFEPNWTRRGMWDKSYYEARVPQVPTMLLELLSHQNFADMKYGLDPAFRFTVSRAIYKGMLQFLAEREGREYVVQPLPVNSFAISKTAANEFRLTWKATKDTLSANADAKEYLVYERINNGAFRKIAVVNQPVYNVIVLDNDIHSYKIVAANEGGVSFPSEVLALGVPQNSKGEVLVVNGFTRVSSPDFFDSGEIAGFYDVKDHGVPYIKDISFIGSQFEFRRDIPWMDDDAAGFGASRANYEDKVVAGNTFDYPAIHGEAIMKAGYGFVSASIKAVENGEVKMSSYQNVDLILGKQKEIKIGSGLVPNRFRIWTPELQNQIRELTSNGGNIFVSGAYVASDIWDGLNRDNEADKQFAAEVLGFKWRVDQASVEGGVYTVPTISKEFKEGTYSYSNELNEEMYAVESPDSLYPSDKDGATFMRYTENNLVAGIIVNKGYKTCIIGFPFETVENADKRAELMTQVLNFFSK